MIRAIMACDNKGGVGYKNSLPWPKLSGDMIHFTKNTLGNVVVMGAKTWQSLNNKPLQARINVVVTTDPVKYPGADGYITEDLCNNIKNLSKNYANKVVWIIGGPSIIDVTWDIIEEFYLTKLNHNYECDAFLDLSKLPDYFDQVSNRKNQMITIDDTSMSFEIWRKKYVVNLKPEY